MHPSLQITCTCPIIWMSPEATDACVRRISIYSFFNLPHYMIMNLYIGERWHQEHRNFPQAMYAIQWWLCNCICNCIIWVTNCTCHGVFSEAGGSSSWCVSCHTEVILSVLSVEKRRAMPHWTIGCFLSPVSHLNRKIEMGRLCVVSPCHWLHGEHSHSSASFCIQRFRSNCNYAIMSLHKL